MSSSDVVVVNATQIKVKERTTKSGATRSSSYAVTTIDTSEPLSFNLDEEHIAKATALAIADQAREQTRAVSAPVKESTADARRVVERAFDRGKAWARRRYSGGRMGITPPVHGEVRKFNHSGRLAKGIVATYRKEQKDFAINYPANRWNPKDWRSLAQMEAKFNEWISYVPVLSKPEDNLAVQRALRDTYGVMDQKHAMGTTEKEAARESSARVEKESLALERLLVESLRAAGGLLGA